MWNYILALTVSIAALAVNVEASCDNSTLALANATQCLDEKLEVEMLCQISDDELKEPIDACREAISTCTDPDIKEKFKEIEDAILVEANKNCTKGQCFQKALKCTENLMKKLKDGGMDKEEVEYLMSNFTADSARQKKYCSAIGDFDVKDTLKCLTNLANTCMPPKRPEMTETETPDDNDVVGHVEDVFKYMCDSRCDDMKSKYDEMHACLIANKAKITEAKVAVHQKAVISNDTSDIENDCKALEEATGKCIMKLNCCPLLMESVMEELDIDESTRDVCPNIQKSLHEKCPVDDGGENGNNGGGKETSGAVTTKPMIVVVVAFSLVLMGLMGW